MAKKRPPYLKSSKDGQVYPYEDTLAARTNEFVACWDAPRVIPPNEGGLAPPELALDPRAADKRAAPSTPAHGRPLVTPKPVPTASARTAAALAQFEEDGAKPQSRGRDRVIDDDSDPQGMASPVEGHEDDDEDPRAEDVVADAFKSKLAKARAGVVTRKKTEADTADGMI